MALLSLVFKKKNKIRISHEFKLLVTVNPEREAMSLNCQ